MNKAQLVEKVAKSTKVNKQVAKQVLDSFLEAVDDSLSHGNTIEIRGFGSFKVKQRKARTARNPRTGDPVQLPPRKVAVFKVSKELKESITDGQRTPSSL